MDVYVVERFLVGWSIDEVDQLVRQLADNEPRWTSHGVRYVESIIIPGDETCLSVFEGPDLDAVRSANDELDLPTGRVLVATASAGRR
jgi:hypothetical protein